MIVGPTGAGKTTCYRLLSQALTTLRERGSKNESFQKVHMHVLNPKCVWISLVLMLLRAAAFGFHDNVALRCLLLLFV